MRLWNGVPQTVFRLSSLGYARSVNIWAVKIVLRLRDNGLPTHLIAANFEHARSPHVIAVLNGENGETKSTIDYADQPHVPVVYIP